MAGKKRASQLFLTHRDMLEQFIHALVNDPGDAEDIFQETALVILEGKARVPDAVEEFPRWSRGVARNVMRHFWRSRRRDRLVPDQDLLAAVEEAYAEADGESGLWMRRRRALDHCLKEVSGDSRRLLDLSYGECLSSFEIAARVKKSAVAVRKALSRIRGVLESCIDQHMVQGSG